VRAANDGTAATTTAASDSLLRSLNETRESAIKSLSPNTNLLFPRTVVPTLTGKHESGTT
jgi:hypothetical protein